MKWQGKLFVMLLQIKGIVLLPQLKRKLFVMLPQIKGSKK
jgi:hypothetical protein